MHYAWFIWLSLALVAAPTVKTAGAAQTVPHEAFYSVTLERLNFPGKVVHSSGEMAMSVSRDCEKWTLRHETNFSMELEGNEETYFVNRYRLYESLDGRRLDFRVVHKQNGHVVLNIKGSATLPADGSSGTARFDLPEARVLPLPPKTGFPMAQAHLTIDRLSAGEVFSRYVLFEGSGVYQVTDVSAGKDMAVQALPEGDLGLLGGESWRVESTLFPYGAIDAEPAGLTVTQTQANGISPAFLVDYGNLVARGELKSIRRLAEPECQAPGR
jgi:hypothetical protein